MKIVLDTNVIISAYTSRGLCADVMEICLTEHELVLSEHILFEVKLVLSKKIKLPEVLVNEIALFLENEAEIINPVTIEKSVCRDKSDLPVIGTAVAGKATLVVSGDNDLLELKKYKQIYFFSPREFWKHLRG